MKRGIVFFLIVILMFTVIGCNEEDSGLAENNEKTSNEKIEDEKITNEHDDGLIGEEPVEVELAEAKNFTDDALNKYSIEAKLNTDLDTIEATQVIQYTNIESVDLTEVYLHLYPNAFKNGSHPSLFDTNVDEIELQYGYVDIVSLTVNGETINHSLSPIDTTLKVPFEFLQGESYVISLEYTVWISTTSERFGIVDGLYNLGNWYPVLAVYDEEGWNLDPYYSIGDPFYSDVSNYDVNMTVPKDYEVAASGYLYDLVETDGMVTHKFRADRMRDFAFVIGEDFLVESTLVGETTVYLYYPESIADNKWLEASLELAASSIELFSYEIGKYPYENYSVVLTNFPSGMEYPGIVFVSTGYLDNYSDENLRNVIVHETAHQWFYGIIGNDEIEEGWIDEGITSYMTAYYDLKLISENYYEGTMSYYKDRIKRLGRDNVITLKSAKDYSDWGEYGAAAYTKPALMYHQLYTDYGEPKFIEFIQLLYEDYAFGILKEEGLRKTMKTVYGDDIELFINDWLK